MFHSMTCGCLLSFSLFLALAGSAWSQTETGLLPVGVAKVDITPDYPVRLSGYSSRKQASEGVAQRIWARAMVLGADEADGPAVLLTVDNCGVPGEMADAVCARLAESGIARQRVAVCSSHSHTAPWLHGFAPFLANDPVSAEDQEARRRYGEQLKNWMVEVVQQARRNRQPASLHWARGSVVFAANRRVLKDGRWTGFGVQAGAPVDHRLPMLVAKNAAGQPIAVWANYACHCTTLGGDFNHICGDWAGYAAERIEADFPNAVPLISIGCGADANPEPRGQLEQARQHGRLLADEVKRLLAGELQPLPGRIACRLNHIDLPFGPLPTREQWVQAAAAGGSRGAHGKHFLELIDAGQSPPASLSYPVAAWTFGEALAVVFLGGEVVVDYTRRIDREFAAERLWVTAYANDVPCYIASKRILEEGGYEADQSMIFYGRPTRLAPQAEDLILEAVQVLLPPGFRKSGS